MKKVLVLNGPNLNLLGLREPELYGAHTLDDLNQTLFDHASKHQLTLQTLQSQSESKLIEAIHNAYQEKVAYIIFNPAAFTHTSIALRDALLAVQIPFIEVHLSQPYQREPFRQVSYFSDIAEGTIAGFGITSYLLALNAVINILNPTE